jgi:hypothetical protein
MAGFTMFVKVQTICARALILVAGMVSTLPARVPNVPVGLPEAAALLSTQLAELMVKFVVVPSVIVTAVPTVVASIGVGTAGNGVLAVEVVMEAGAEARLVDVNVKAPPAEPSVVFWTATVAAPAVLTVFVIVHVMLAAARTFAAGMVTTLPASVPKVTGLPVIAEFASVQLTAVGEKLGAAVSVIVTAVLKAVTVLAVGTAGVAVLMEVVVIAGGAEARFVDVNVNGPPIAPDVIFCTATVAGFAVLVNVQASESP